MHTSASQQAPRHEPESIRIEARDGCRVFTRETPMDVDQDSPREPYITFTMGDAPVRRLLIRTWSRDQGYAGPLRDVEGPITPYTASHTWFEIGPADAHPPEHRVGFKLHANVRASPFEAYHQTEFNNLQSPILSEQRDELASWIVSAATTPGLVLAIFPRAKYPNWRNFVSKIEVTLYHDNPFKYLDLGVQRQKIQHAMVSRSLSQADIVSYKRDLVPLLANHAMRSEDIAHLDAAIQLCTELEKLYTSESPHHLSACHNDSGVCYLMRHNNTQREEDLSRAIDYLSRAVEKASPEAPRGYVPFSNHVIALGILYKYTQSETDRGRLERARRDLDDCNQIEQEVTDTVTFCEANFGLRYEYVSVECSCSPEGVETITGLPWGTVSLPARATTSTAIPDLGVYAKYLRCGEDLLEQHGETGSLDDLSESIQFATKAIESCTNNAQLAMCLFLHGQALVRRGHTLTGDFHVAIESLSRSVDLTAECDTNLLPRLVGLAAGLLSQYEEHGSAKALDQIQGALDRANQIASNVSGHKHMASLYYSCGTMHWYRAERETDDAVSSLDKAIDYMRRAINVASTQSHDVPIYHKALGDLFQEKFKRTGNAEDLETGLRHARLAAQALESTNINTGPCLHSLSGLLALKFDKSTEKSASIIDEAIKTQQLILDIRPDDDPDRAECWLQLGALYARKAITWERPEDFIKSCSCYETAASCEGSPPSRRIKGAELAGRMYAGNEPPDWEKASKYLRQAILLLPLLNPRSSPQEDTQEFLASKPELASHAAAVAYNNGEQYEDVLSLLELGRGVIANSILDTRVDVSDLEEDHPDLFERFTQLRDELNKPIARASATATQRATALRTRHDANRELDHVISSIRGQPGYENFLLPPRASDLLAAAAPGPIIVVNVSYYGSAAFLVTQNGIHVRELPELEPGELNLKASKIVVGPPLLDWLWKTVCRPCLDALDLTKPLEADWPRVWWIPTGYLSRLPLHAAARDIQGSKETVMDRVISSYALSINSLQFSRRQNRVGPQPSQLKDEAILVSMNATPGNYDFLPSANEETTVVESLCHNIGLRPTRIEPPVHRADVLDHLDRCDILHFAGHGKIRIDPSESTLLLTDWKDAPLTVADLRAAWVRGQAPFIAYLSACSSAVSVKEGLADENVHIASAVQLAGFRNVVGTLWSVSDSLCAEVARVVYETIRDEGRNSDAVSLGLHRALRALRQKPALAGQRNGSERPKAAVAGGSNDQQGAAASMSYLWVPYIHYGP